LIKIIFGIFFILHGFVFLLYSGQSFRLFELQPGMAWPDGSWVFSKLLGDNAVRLAAGIFFIFTAIGFIAGGIGIFAAQAWWHPAVIYAAVFSSVLIILFWDGGLQKLADKGGIGILINLAILVSLLIFHWPALEL
jgi:hypothetical protein